MTLLKSEIYDLRKANEALSKRRRAPRTRLQDRGAMTLEEGRDVIDQMEIDRQVVGELSRNHRRGDTAQPRERRCGMCGETGHNIRTCQAVIETSGDEDSN